LSGDKFSSRHQTFVPGAEGFLRGLKALRSTKKIALGEINSTRPGPRRVKVRSVNGNFIVAVFRDVNATQVFNITAMNANDVVEFINGYKP
jgi:hypothetical protein